MKVVDLGHKYELDCVEGGQPIAVQFIKKEIPEGGDEKSKLVTVYDGTTTEAVLVMLIDRLKFVNEKLPDDRTSLAINNLENTLQLLEERTKDRKARAVEGTAQA